MGDEAPLRDLDARLGRVEAVIKIVERLMSGQGDDPGDYHPA